MALSRLFVDDRAETADHLSFTVVPLVRLHKLYAAVALSLFLPVYKRLNSLPGLFLARECPAWVGMPVLRRPEKGFRVRIVIRHPWSGEGTEYIYRLMTAFHRGRTHGIPVVGMQIQRLFPAITYQLALAGLAHQTRCDESILVLGDIPGHNLETHTSITILRKSHTPRTLVGM